MSTKICDITLTVSKLDRAMNFYENSIGLRKIGESDNWAKFDAGGINLIIATRDNMERYRHGEPDIGFEVDDLDKVYQYLRRRKTHCIEPPHDIETGKRTAVFSDPDGNRIRMVQA